MATFSINVDVNSKSVNELEEDLKTLETQFKTLKIGDPGFTELGQKIQGVRSQLKDIELQFEGLDKEQRATALVDTFNGLTGAVGAVSSAFIAFGAESSAIEDAEKKLLGVIGVVSGLRDVSNGLVAAGKLFGPTFSKIGESISGAFTTGSTAAQGFKAALASIGIGLVIAAVTTLITSFDELKSAFGFTSKEVDDFNKKQEEAQKELQKTAEEARITAGLAINELQNSFNNVAQAGGDASTVLTDIQKQLPELANVNLAAAGSQDKVNEALNRFNSLTLLQTDRQNNINKLKQEEIALSEAVSLKLAATTEADKKALDIKVKGIFASINAIRDENKELDIQIAKIQSQRAAEIKAVEDEKKRQQEAEAARKQAEANRKDAAQKELRATKDKNEALRKLDEERATEGLDAITTQFANNLARLKESQSEELKQTNLTEAAKAAIKAKYNALIEANELQRVDAVAKFEKDAADKVEEADKKKLEATTERNKAFLDLSRALGDEAAQNAVDAVQRQIDAVAATTVAGVEQIGQLQKTLIEKERANAVAAAEQTKTDRLAALQEQLDAELLLYAGNEQKQLELKATYATQVEAVTKQTAENVTAINADANAKIVENDKQTAEQKKQIQEAQLQAALQFANTVVGALDGIAKEGTEAQKAVDIAKILISAATAAFQAFAQATALIPPPGGQIVGAALAGVIAVGAARAIADVKKVKPGGGGGGPAAPAAGAIVQPPAPATGQGTFTPLLPQGGTTIGSGGAQTTTLGNDMSGGRVIKTYVLAGDVTDAQEAEARINQRRQL
jgi:hypothetical protein